MTNLKYRLLTIALLVIASVWALYPRKVVERVKRNGVFVFDTVTRVPLKRGLDLQKKLLIFPLAEVPEMARGRGIMLMCLTSLPLAKRKRDAAVRPEGEQDEQRYQPAIDRRPESGR